MKNGEDVHHLFISGCGKALGNLLFIVKSNVTVEFLYSTLFFRLLLLNLENERPSSGD